MRKRLAALQAGFAAAGVLLGLAAHGAQPKWEAAIPPVAAKSADWIELSGALQQNRLYAGSLAAASRMLMFLTDLESKETAYRTVLNVVEQGYPAPVQPLFQAGDLNPAGDYDFVNGYNLYKAMLNRDKGFDRWARQYLEGVDRKNYYKFIFIDALEAYSKKDYAKTESRLKELLAREWPIEKMAFAKKIARTLARAYFDQEKWTESYDIYASYLLKTQPIEPRDWLEAAWNLFYLRKYPEALGMLYNLESNAAEKLIGLEKYTLRAMIYRNQCAVNHSEQLVQSFQKDFGDIIEGLKRGAPLSQFPRLAELDAGAQHEYSQLRSTLDVLESEYRILNRLPKAQQALAQYLYKSEITSLRRKSNLYREAALQKASIRLIMMDENLRFLKFSVQREKYNPDTVFADPGNVRTLMDAPVDSAYRIRWLQVGDFWRDERVHYEGNLPNRCFE